MIPHISFGELAQLVFICIIIGFLLGCSMMHWLHRTFNKKQG